MTDVLFVLLLAALFAATAGTVVLCDRLLGADDSVVTVPDVDGGETRRAAA